MQIKKFSGDEVLALKKKHSEIGLMWKFLTPIC